MGNSNHNNLIVFKIIERKKNLVEISIIYIFWICLLGILSSALTNSYSIFIFFVLMLFILMFTWLGLKQFGILIKYSAIGKLILNEKSIILSIKDNPDVFIELTGGTNITIKYNGYKGLFINNHYCYGDSNAFVVDNVQTRFNVKVLAEDAGQIEFLKSLMSIWYKSKIHISETGINGGKSFLLNTKLSFHELQEAKNKIGLIA